MGGRRNEKKRERKKEFRGKGKKKKKEKRKKNLLLALNWSGYFCWCPVCAREGVVGRIGFTFLPSWVTLLAVL